MRMTLMFATAAAAAIAIAAPAQADTITYNSAPTDTFIYGSGNAYVPANSAVNTNSDNELALRFHQTYVVAPSAPNGVYTFALGTDPISFDWSIDGKSDNALLTIFNLATGASLSYSPFCPHNDPPTCSNDNVTGSPSDPDLSQNSFRLDWVNDVPGYAGFFNPNVNSTYGVTLTAGGHSLTTYAQMGTGVPEPATWAMMLLGFGGIGVSMRRKRAMKLPQIA